MTAGLLHKEPRIGAPRDDFNFLGHVRDCACFVSFLLFFFPEIAKLLSVAAVMSPLFTHVELECFSNLVVQLSAWLLQAGGKWLLLAQAPSVGPDLGAPIGGDHAPQGAVGTCGLSTVRALLMWSGAGPVEQPM